MRRLGSRWLWHDERQVLLCLRHALHLNRQEGVYAFKVVDSNRAQPRMISNTPTLMVFTKLGSMFMASIKFGASTWQDQRQQQQRAVRKDCRGEEAGIASADKLQRCRGTTTVSCTGTAAAQHPLCECSACMHACPHLHSSQLCVQINLHALHMVHCLQGVVWISDTGVGVCCKLHVL